MVEEQREQIVSARPGALEGEAGPSLREPKGQRLLWSSLTALGIVFGDIGTSPLYALHKCFHGEASIVANPANVLGVLSLVFWTLMIVISVKYVLYVMRADNHGEGGILALSALVVSRSEKGHAGRWLLMVLGIFGAALLYGDGMITPAISVLSAVEGVQVATPEFNSVVVPITVVILILLFLFQRRGTAGVGAVFGPVMLLWFVTIAGLGVVSIVRRPEVLWAINPVHAVRFFLANGWPGFLVLGAVFLVATGGEALYADIGHFGRRPIRLAWFALVLPALLVNYFGQGALLLGNPEAALHPFYLLTPGWGVYPLVILATLATVIASQAVISGAFSLTRQAVLLGDLPRLRIVQTSHAEIGQVYIPSVNWLLMIATILLVVGFRRSDNLAAAYGVAVSATMIITTLLAYRVARTRWHWSLWTAVAVTAGLIVVDLAFFGANILKIEQGGWVPLAVGAAVFTLMSTWKRGRTLLNEQVESRLEPLDAFLTRIAAHPPPRVPGAAVFLTSRYRVTPPTLNSQLQLNQVLREQVVLLTVANEEVPHVPDHRRLEIAALGQGFFHVVAHFGFMDNPDLPKALEAAGPLGLTIDMPTAAYYVRREVVLFDGRKRGMAAWRESLFAFLDRNAADPVAFYRLPPERVVELGLRVPLDGSR